MSRRSLRAGLLVALVGGTVMAVAPSATAAPSCQPAGGGTICTTTDSGGFGLGIHEPPLNVCVVILARCP